jgi:hypothetical protein
VKFKLPFGLKEGELVEVSQVENGLKCNCFCPSCGHPLVARKGEKTHHFAHHKSSDCVGALETALHYAAKEILERQKRIRIPAVTTAIGGGYGTVFDLFKEQYISFDNVYLEKHLDSIIPDVIIEIKGKRMLIEIAVTHFIDKNKKTKIRELNISTLEVNLSKLDRQITLAELESILIDSLENKKWIYNTKQEAFKNQIERFGEDLDVYHRGMASHIDDCPLSVRVWKGKSYANFIDDCIYCEYFFNSLTNEHGSTTHVNCVGHAKEQITEIVNKYRKD